MVSKNNNICAPTKYDSKLDTCFSLEVLIELAGAYNRYVTKIKLSPKKNKEIEVGGSSLIKITNDKKYLHDELKSRFDQVCGGNEICITTQKFMVEVQGEMDQDILYGTFRVTGPPGQKEWLSTKDIDGIMQQYEEPYPEFKFLGAVPLDCDKLNFCALYNLNFDQHMKRGKEKLGIVFNHDRHGQSGSHWVGLYINIPKGQCYYCDSLGKKPFGDILDGVAKFKTYYKKKFNSEVDYQWNKNPYQKDGSECGVYSCNFLIRSLAGESFDEITNNPLTFEEINACRNIYFSNQPSKHHPNEARCDPVSFKK